MADSGGAAYELEAVVNFSNCSFWKNSANLGGAIYNETSAATIANCTFSANTATSGGGALVNDGNGTVTIVNSILWGDEYGETPDEIHNMDGTITVTYSDVQGGYSGTGNIAGDSLFADAATGILGLSATSPCIDHGTPSGTGLATKDLEGNPRVVDGSGDGSAVVDMGAFEYQKSDMVKLLYGDFGSDGIWKYDGTWTKITASNPEAMAGKS